MSERVLKPRHLDVSYAAIGSYDEAGLSNAPISSKKTKKIPKSSIMKNHSAVSKKKEPPYTPAFDPASLPDAQWFEPLIHPRPLHKAYNKLPPALGNLDIIEHINIFQLFFTDYLLEAFSDNTNHYAAQKRAEKGLGNMRGRAWKDTTSKDIKCWIGIVIYMGVVGLPAVRDYWSTDASAKNRVHSDAPGRTQAHPAHQAHEKFSYLHPYAPAQNDIVASFAQKTSSSFDQIRSSLTPKRTPGPHLGSFCPVNGFRKHISLAE